MAGMVLGQGRMVKRVADGFYAGVDPVWAFGEDASLVAWDPYAPGTSLKFSRRRILTVTLESKDPSTPVCGFCGQDLPSFVITPMDPQIEDELSDAYRRYLTQEPDPFAKQCIYLTDEKIREHLHWDNLDAPEAWKQKFF